MVNEMHCDRLERCLDQYMDRDVPEADRAALDQHIDECATCQGLLAREQRLRNAMRQLPVAEPQADFYARAMARAAQAAPATRRMHWRFAAAAALAASIATWFVVGHFTQPVAPTSASPVATVTMAVNEARTIQLVFDSATAVKDARLSLKLPPGVELANHRDRRDFRWKTQLRAGKNTLPLDLVVRDGVGGDLVARLSQGSDFRIFKVKVTVFTRSNNA